MSMSDYANHDDDMRGGTGSVWRCAPAVSSEIPSCGPIVDMYPYIHDDEWNLSRNELVRLLNDARGAAEVVEEHSRQELDAARIGHAADVRFVSAELNELADMIVAQFERFARAMSEWFDAPQARTILGGYDREAFKASARTDRLTSETAPVVEPASPVQHITTCVQCGGTGDIGGDVVHAHYCGMVEASNEIPAALKELFAEQSRRREDAVAAQRTNATLPVGSDNLIALGWKIEPWGDGLKVTDPTESEMYLYRSEIGRGAVTWLSIGAERQSIVKP